ncbi:MAG: O-antigen ligase family protein [Leptospiraceae bacterium]|nr:O-antigen ligase family protein [Leptospiraceae bacterium]
MIVATVFTTKPASIQEFRAYGLLITLIPIILVIRNIPEISISKFLYLLVTIFIVQGLVLNFNIIRDLLFVHHTLQPRGTIIGIPVSSIGSLGSLGFFISASLILYNKSNRVQSTLGFLLFAISLMLLYFSYSRTSIIASIIVFFIIYVLAFKKNIHLFYKNKIILILIIVLLGISLFVFIQKSFELNTFHARLSIWEFHLKSVLQFSPYFGLGMEPEWRMIYSIPKNLSQASFYDLIEYLKTFRSNPIAHNLIIQTFSSFGFLGIFALLSFLIYLTFPIYKFLFKKEISLYNLLYTATLIGILIHELTDVSLLEHQILYPVVGIIALLKPKTDNKNEGFLKYINFSVIFISTILILFSITQINLMKIHKKDLKNIYSPDNLMYLIEKEPGNFTAKWSQPKTDIIFKILPEKNFYKMRYFYNLHKFKSNGDVSFISQATSDLKKCILLKPEEPLCIFYLAEAIQYLEPDQFANITEFLYTIAKIQDPFFTISKENNN